MTLPSCNTCGQCNRKGRPSVTRESAYCDSHKKYGHKDPDRIGLVQRFRNFISERRMVKVKTDEKDEYGKPLFEEKFSTTKGFRPSWFWR
jgi:hypothetical protein